MRVIKSVVTTDTILTSSNIPEDEYPAWVASVSYNASDRVIYKHIIYEAILANSSATTPDLDQKNWLSLGATNRYRMFDNVVSNVSSRTGGIQFTLTPNEVVNGIAFLNINATTVRVVVTDPTAGVVYRLRFCKYNNLWNSRNIYPSSKVVHVNKRVSSFVSAKSTTNSIRRNSNIRFK